MSAKCKSVYSRITFGYEAYLRLLQIRSPIPPSSGRVRAALLEKACLQSLFIMNKIKNKNPVIFYSILIVKHFLVIRKASSTVIKHTEIILNSLKIKEALTLDLSLIKGQQCLSIQYYNYVSLYYNYPLYHNYNK